MIAENVDSMLKDRPRSIVVYGRTSTIIDRSLCIVFRDSITENVDSMLKNRPRSIVVYGRTSTIIDTIQNDLIFPVLYYRISKPKSLDLLPYTITLASNNITLIHS